MSAMMQDHQNLMLWENLLRCQTWINEALAESGGTHDFIDIVDGVIAGQFQFWPTPNACIVTTIVTYPRKAALHVFLAGGDMQEILDMQDPIIAWAKRHHGISLFMLAGRLGWTKVMREKGWKPGALMMLEA